MTAGPFTSDRRRWLNAVFLVTSVACLPLATGLYGLALAAGGSTTLETCGRMLGEPALHYEQEFFPVIRKTCVGRSARVELLSPSAALPAVACLAMTGLGVVRLRREGRRVRA